MALVDKLTDRISANRALNLSNPDLPGASANDTARLQAAADDAQAIFETITISTYDNTNTRHVAYAVGGAEIILRVRSQGMNPFTDPDFLAWEKRLETVAATLGKAPFSPKHSSNYTPSVGETGKPPFDNDNLNDWRLKAPRSGSTDPVADI